MRKSFPNRETQVVVNAPLPALRPYQRCVCGKCRECQDNERWDRVFAKYQTPEDEWETKGFFQSTLRGW